MDADQSPTFAIRPSPVVMLVAIATGILIADCGIPTIIPVTIIATSALVLVAFVVRDSSGTIRTLLVLMAISLVTTGWAHTRFAPGSPRDALDARLVCLEGRIAGHPTRSTLESGDSIARFMMLRSSVRLQLNVDRATTGWSSDQSVPWQGRVEVILPDGGYSLPPPGTPVRVLGRWMTPSSPRNPGERNAIVRARRRGIAGRVIVESSQHLNVLDASPIRHRHIVDHVRSLTLGLRAEARQVIPEAASPECASLLAALLLGTREPGFSDVYASFRRVGLAHVLAISGMHLVIVVGGGVVLVRLLTPDPRLEWVVTAVLLTLYVALVPARVPISRAAMMIGIWLATQMTGTRLRAIDICAIAGAIILVADPGELFMPGFQLSFGVVATMILLTHRLERMLFVRWSERGLANPFSNRGWSRRWIETSTAASLVAWLASTPLAAFHFGMITPLAAPLSVASGPLVSVLLILGYVRGVAAHLHMTPLLMLIDPLIILGAQTWLSVVEFIGQFPGVLLHVRPPHVVWVVAWMALLFVVVGMPVRSLRRRRAMWVGVGLIAIIPLFPPSLRPGNLWRGSPALSVTMFDVGDGSAYLLQSGAGGHNAIMIDAGSRGDASVGDRVLVPGMRARGVRRLRTLVVTHADLDHYGGAIAVMREMRPRVLIVTPQIVTQWTAESDGPLAMLHDASKKHGVDIQVRARGDQVDVSRRVQMSWLHPDAASDLGSDNNNSAVIRVDITTDGPARRLLFTGDIEAPAIRSVLRSTDRDELRADILELPHHGSWSANAIRLVRTVSPRVILQSTGRSRMENDRWMRVVDSLEGTRRYVTSRDGAVTVVVTRQGAVEVEAYVSGESYDSEK